MGCGRSKRTSTGEPEEAKSDHGQAGQGKGPREETAGGGEDRGTGTEGSPNGAPDTDTEAPGEDRTTPPATTTETCPEHFNDFQLTTLRLHNEYRAKHGSPPLALNSDICGIAQRWADHLAANKIFEHSSDSHSLFNGQNTGENIFMTASTDPNLSGEGASESWYSEIKDYKFDEHGVTGGTGHFSQLVWRGSTELGVGSTTYKDGDFYKMVVCANYFPAGNVVGQFESNVMSVMS